MKIFSEVDLSSFEFWSGAVATADYILDDEWETLEAILTENYPDGMDETELNDLFWFEEDIIADWLGFEDFEALINEREDCS